MKRFTQTAWIALAVVFVASGSDCRRQLYWPWANQVAVPQVLSPNPTLDEVVRAVNGNSAGVQSMSSNYASLSVPGSPSLRAAVFAEKPGRFRIRGSTALTGPEMDLGANDELYWMWIKRVEPPAVYYARHSQLAASGAKQLIPLTPQQLIEAIGIPTLDPQASHQGPFQQGPDRLVIRSSITSAQGVMTKTTIVDARSAWVVEQQLHDAAGQPIATVKTTDHRQDTSGGPWLPHTITLSIPSASISMTLGIDRWDVNVPAPAETWQKPELQGFPNVDVTDPRQMPAAPLAAGGIPATGTNRMTAASPVGSADNGMRYGDRRVDPGRDTQWRAAGEDAARR